VRQYIKSNQKPYLFIDYTGLNKGVAIRMLYRKKQGFIKPNQKITEVNPYNLKFEENKKQY